MIKNLGEYCDFIDAALAEVGINHKCQLLMPRNSSLLVLRVNNDCAYKVEAIGNEDRGRSIYKAICLARESSNGPPVDGCFECWWYQDILECDHV